jgi:type II secretory pathway pseudopilin PulG
MFNRQADRTADHPTPSRPNARGVHAARPAFTIVELLTVIFIIALLIAILLPALGAVRSSGRQAASQSLLTGLTQAAGQFELDNRRQPGYFDADVIGSTVNSAPGGGTPGLTYLENAMLDLSGNGAISVDQPADPIGWIQVNPTGDADDAIWVKPDLIGASEDAYFLPSAENLGYMTQQQQPCTINAQAVGEAVGLPDLIDPFGQPILAWIENNNGPRSIRAVEQFATTNVQDSRAAFYWAGNGSMLSSPSLGEQGQNMTLAPIPGQVGSLIGQPVGNNPQQVRGVMAALLGHPGYPDEALLAGGDYANIYPLRPRGSFIAHSAGPDGVYLGAADNRLSRVVPGDALGGGSFNVTYGVNFFRDTSGARRVGENNQNETLDFLEAFDDVVVSQ